MEVKFQKAREERVKVQSKGKLILNTYILIPSATVSVKLNYEMR